VARGPDNNLDEVASLFAEVFGIPAEAVTPSTSADDVESWDSMGHLVLVQTLEERFRVTLETNEIFEIVDAGTALTVLRRHGAIARAD
jgi:acyl carrier protein